MRKRSYLLGLSLTLLYVSVANANYPVMDAIANKIITKYQQSTCEQLWLQKAKKAPPTQQEQEAVQILRGDPQMRAAFIAKMFDCGMIP